MDGGNPVLLLLIKKLFILCCGPERLRLDEGTILMHGVDIGT